MIEANIKEEELREKIIKLALLEHHKRYIHGSNGPDTFDCAGLIWFVYNEICNINLYKNGIGLSTTTKIMTNNNGILYLFDEDSYKDISSIKIGDILLFHRQSLSENVPTPYNKYPGHTGIYLGDNKFIHAIKCKDEVVISDFYKNDYWLNILIGYKDVITSFNNDYQNVKKLIKK